MKKISNIEFKNTDNEFIKIKIFTPLKQIYLNKIDFNILLLNN